MSDPQIAASGRYSDVRLLPASIAIATALLASGCGESQPVRHPAVTSAPKPAPPRKILTLPGVKESGRSALSIQATKAENEAESAAVEEGR
jgi:hypothetical protein